MDQIDDFLVADLVTFIYDSVKQQFLQEV